MWWLYQSGDNTLDLSYNGTQYSLGSQTLASTDVVRNGWQPTIGSAPSTADAYFNSTIDIANAQFSFWTWNGISDVKPNFNIVGDLNFNGGVLSRFSEDNYATISREFNPGSSPWEMVFKVTTGSLTGPETITRGLNDWGWIIRVNSDTKKWALYLSGNNTSWDIANGSLSPGTAPANTTLWAKLAFTGSAYTFATSTTGYDTSYTTLITVNSSTPVASNSGFRIGKGSMFSAEGWKGTIDLNESYININGRTWWKWNGVTEAGYSWQTFPAAKIGEVTMKNETVQPNITVNGTLTNNNGVFSGFSADNYITTQAFQPGNQPWEMVFKVTTPSSTGTGLFLSSGLNLIRLNIYMFVFAQ